MAVVSDVEIRLRADIARLQADMDRARQAVSGTMGRIKSVVEDAKKALVAFSVALGIGAVVAFAAGIKGMVSANIEAIGSLYDLSLQTGASVAALTAFRDIGATSDTTVETLASSMNKLSKGMAVTNEESKGLPQAIAAIGLKFDDLRKLNPEDQMIAIAKAFDNFGTGAGKSAVAMAFYGKEGAKLLPFLADLAAESDKVNATLTDQQKAAMLASSAMADNYGDALTQIEKASKQTGKAFSEGLLPALYETSTAVLAVMTESGGLRDAMRQLAKDGTIAEWARGSVTAITYLLDALNLVTRLIGLVQTTVFGALRTMYTYVSGSASALKSFIEGDYKKSFAIMKETSTSTGDVIKGTFSDLGSLLTDDMIGKKLRAQLKIAREAKAEAADNKPQVDFKPAPETNAALEKQIKAFHDLTAAMRTHVEETARAAAGLTPYNEAQKEGIKLTEELAAGKRKLSPAQEAEIRGYIKQWETNLQVIDTLEKSKKAAEDMAKTEQKLADDRAAGIKKASDEADANEELVATFGTTKAAIEQVELARLKEQLAQRGSVGMTADEITQLENLIALKERSANAVANVEAMTQAKEFWTSIDKTAHDTFVSIADGSKGAFQRMKESAKNVFFDWLYSMTVKKWIVNIAASTDGGGIASALAGGTSAVSGAGGLSSLLSAGSAISNVYGALTGGLTLAGGVGTGFVGSLAGGLAGAGAGSGLTSALGLSIGNSVAGVLGPAVSGALSSGIGMLATALPWVAGAAAVFTIAKKAFGMGNKEMTGTTLNGDLSGGGFAGTLDSAWKQKGGWFRSDKSGVDKTAVDAALAASLGTTYQAITDTSASYAKVLGLSADSIATRTQRLSIVLGKDEAANKKAIEDFFIGVGNSIAQELLPNIAMFQMEGEAAATTLQRLASDFQTVSGILEQMGTTTQQAFGATGAAAITASERLIELAGGVSALSSQAQYFADNFLTQAERVAPAQQQLTDVLGALGYGYVKSIEQYKTAVLDLARSGTLATEAGAQTYAALLALAPAFKTVTDYTKELKTAATESANTALEVLSKSVNAQKDIVTAGYTAAMTKVEASITSLNDTISTTTELSAALKAAMGSVEAPGSDAATRNSANAQIATALAIAKASGILPSAASLADALSAGQADASGQFSNLADYQREVARTNAMLAQLGGLTDGQLSTAEQHLAATVAQKDAMAIAYAAEISRLDNLVTAAQQQINAVNGVNTTLVTIGQALVGVYGAAQTLAGYTGISATAVSPSNTASGTINDNAALLAEMQTLNQRIANMEVAAARTADSTDQFARQFNSVSAGGNALITEAG